MEFQIVKIKKAIYFIKNKEKILNICKARNKIKGKTNIFILFLPSDNVYIVNIYFNYNIFISKQGIIIIEI